MERDLTSGSVFRNVIYFSLPYFLSYFLQTLYGMADLFIVGQFDGVASTTAVSIGSQVMHMLTVMIVGLAMGATVSIGQSIGAGDKKRTSVFVGNTVILFMGISLVLAVLLLFFVKPAVAVMSTPAEAVSGTAAYLTICFLGIPFITAYNVISSIFRGLGDSKSPMYFIAVACAVNIILDYLFIGFFHLGASGAALGTTLSQACSVLFALIAINRRSGKRSPRGPDRTFSFRRLFPPTEKTAWQNSEYRDSGSASGRIYSDCFHYYYDHCQPARTERSRCCRHCGKNHQLSVPDSVFHAFDCFCTRSSEYRCRKV